MGEEDAEKRISASTGLKQSAAEEIDRIIQLRAALVLAEIRDERAIPILNHLAETTNNEFTKKVLALAIKKIKNN